MNSLLILRWLNLGFGSVALGLMARDNGCAKNMQDGFFRAGTMLLVVLSLMIVVQFFNLLLGWRKK